MAFDRVLWVIRSVILAALLVPSALLVWPYISVLGLNQAVLSDDTAALSEMVDLDGVRSSIKQKLNKDVHSPLGDLSDGFVQWLERGFRTEGQGAVDRLVTIDWVRAVLLRKSLPDEGFLPQLTYAFFDELTVFRLRIGPESQQPVHVRLQLTGLSWRITALYY